MRLHTHGYTHRNEHRNRSCTSTQIQAMCRLSLSPLAVRPDTGSFCLVANTGQWQDSHHHLCSAQLWPGGRRAPQRERVPLERGRAAPGARLGPCPLGWWPRPGRRGQKELVQLSRGNSPPMRRQHWSGGDRPGGVGAQAPKDTHRSNHHPIAECSRHSRKRPCPHQRSLLPPDPGNHSSTFRLYGLRPPAWAFRVNGAQQHGPLCPASSRRTC